MFSVFFGDPKFEKLDFTQIPYVNLQWKIWTESRKNQAFQTSDHPKNTENIKILKIHKNMFEVWTHA